MTSPFTIYPAIDLRGGRVVRLQEGDPARQTTFSDAPVAVARRWLAAGAEWLHVVDLDGALSEGGATRETVRALAQTGAHIQFGGGLRSLEAMGQALESGAERIVVGTVAVEQPVLVAEAVRRFGAERVVVALDARDGQVQVRGWQQAGGVSAADLGRAMARHGVRLALHTDIGRDGLLTGANVAASAALARESGLQVLVSGGVASLDDVRRAVAYRGEGITGIIIGRAAYEGDVSLEEALAIAAAVGPDSQMPAGEEHTSASTVAHDATQPRKST